jgi:hypothetical protein
MLGHRLAGKATGSATDAIKLVAANAAGLTTDVSAVQLELAACDRFSEALLDVAAALTGGWVPLVSDAVTRCLAQGATSGADGLLGLSAGILAGHTARTGADVPFTWQDRRMIQWA